jgi:hypothetical protein
MTLLICGSAVDIRASPDGTLSTEDALSFYTASNNDSIGLTKNASLLQPRKESVNGFSFPFGPLFQQFILDLEDRACYGFMEAIQLALAGLSAIGSDPSCRRPAFRRYFHERDVDKVRSMLSLLVGATGNGPPEMSVWPLSVVYGNRPGTIGDAGDEMRRQADTVWVFCKCQARRAVSLR